MRAAIRFPSPPPLITIDRSTIVPGPMIVFGAFRRYSLVFIDGFRPRHLMAMYCVFSIIAVVD